MDATLAEGCKDGGSNGLISAAAWLRTASETKKCWACGCLRSALDGIGAARPEAPELMALDEVVAAARERLVPSRYECLGCAECYPALALNALGAAGGCGVDIAVCPTEAVEARSGWPPLPGSFKTVRYRAPVAVCALNSEELVEAIAAAEPERVAIAGTLQTENLGIERIVTNVISNPSIRFVVVCGADSAKAIGHLPGQSLVAFARHGLDADKRIVGAKGKRPVLRNLDVAAAAHFRATVEVVDLVGVTDPAVVAAAVRDCAGRNLGAAEPFAGSPPLAAVPGAIPARMTSDPLGYFVIFLDRARKLLSLEHYENTGVLTTIVEAKSAAEVYMAAIGHELLSRLDHAAYLGRELARAEAALRSGEPYVQDAAPEQCGPTCSCHAA